MIEYFKNTKGVTFEIEDPQELYQALEILINQIKRNMPKSNQKELIPIMEEAMDKIVQIGYCFNI